MGLFRDHKSYSRVNTDEETNRNAHIPERQNRSASVLLAIHLMIFGGWILTIYNLLTDGATSSGEQSYATLRHEPFPFERRLMTNPLGPDGTVQSNFVKEPSRVVDDAWAELLKYSNLRFTAAELDSIDPARKDSAVQLPDGGYFGSLSVYHDLHCIKSIYRFLYASHYHPSSTPEQIELRQLHIIHCLDMLRADVMCWGDLTPFTMQWTESHRKPSANFSSPRKCVNWDALSGWARERHVEHLFEPGYLKHPIFGDVFGHDTGTIGRPVVNHSGSGATGRSRLRIHT